MSVDKCPKCGSRGYGPGPGYDQFRWIGCYACGYGFRKHFEDTKPTASLGADPLLDAPDGPGFWWWWCATTQRWELVEITDERRGFAGKWQRVRRPEPLKEAS